ncbi:hypothetical protein BBJ28_00023471 [Nothophytophthora sp. Chile5]|nr:hypothetical protein BBJ28_00023471 [Nothophytophthora sp. Chile5]
MLQRALELVVRAWDAVHVEHKGAYSVARLQRLHLFIQQDTKILHETTRSYWLRMVAVTFGAPLPCLAVALLSDSMPLAPPEAGPRANGVFWIRSWLVMACYTFAIFSLVLHCVPALPQRLLLLVPISAGIGAAHAALHFTVATVLGFPVPFSNLTLDIPWVMLIVETLWIYMGPECRSSPMVRLQLKKFVVALYAASSLAIVYPLFYFMFLTVKEYPHVQILLTLLVLPVIKLLEKLFLYHVTCHIPDLQPVYLAFNVEVFNTLFVSSCMCNTTSIAVTASLMAVDFLGACAALYGLRNLMAHVDTLNAKMGTAVTREHMLDIAILIATCRQPEVCKDTATLDQTVANASHSSTGKTPAIKKHKVSIAPLLVAEHSDKSSSPVMVTSIPTSKTPRKKKRVAPMTNAVFPTEAILPSSLPPEPSIMARSHDNITAKTIERLSTKERQHYAREASRLLCRVEFLLVVEYTEVIVPMVYAIYVTAVYHLPNRMYFPYLRDMTETDLAITVSSVLLYGALQLLSFMLLMFALSRRFQLTPNTQLRFTLQSEWKLVQGLLTLWVVYVLQSSLDHGGAYAPATTIPTRFRQKERNLNMH